MMRVACLFAALLCLAGMPAHAADKPLLPAPEKKAAAGPHDWSGFYAGVHGGYARSDSQWSNGPSSSATPSFGAGGGTFGAHAGYNYQLGSGVVLGTESDLSR